MKLEFTIEGKAAAGRPRINKGGRGMHNTPNVARWKAVVKEQAFLAMREHQVETAPEDVPVGLMVDVYLPWAKGKPKKVANSTTAHVSKPDSDNLLKPIMDGLSEASVWQDDNQVDRIFLQKWRCPIGEERTAITVTWGT